MEPEEMKKIEAIIKPFKLGDLKEAVGREGVTGMTVTEVRGFGRQKGESEVYRGREFTAEFIPKLKVEIVIADSEVNDVLKAVIRAARTGSPGDGKVFVSPMTDVVRVRTSERSESAI